VKRAILFVIIGVVVLMPPCVVYAKSSTRYGVGGNFARFSVNDPDGSTDTATAVYLSGIMTTPLNRNNASMRVWYELNYRAFTLDPSETELGQKVKSFSLSATAQKAWGASSVGAYWAGLGGELGFDDYQNRHTVDSVGFLKKKYDDRTQTGIGLLLNAGMNLKKTQSGYFPGINVNYHIPFGDGIKGVGITVFLLW